MFRRTSLVPALTLATGAHAEVFLEFDVMRLLVSTHKDQTTSLTLPGFGMEAAFLIDPLAIRLSSTLQSGLFNAPTVALGWHYAANREAGILLNYNLYTHGGKATSKTFAVGPYFMAFGRWGRLPIELTAAALLEGTESAAYAGEPNLTRRSLGFLMSGEISMLHKLARDIYATSQVGARFERVDLQGAASTGAGLLLGVGIRAFL